MQKDASLQQARWHLAQYYSHSTLSPTPRHGFVCFVTLLLFHCLPFPSPMDRPGCGRRRSKRKGHEHGHGGAEGVGLSSFSDYFMEPALKVAPQAPMATARWTVAARTTATPATEAAYSHR